MCWICGARRVVGSREDDAYWNDKYAEPVENTYSITLGVSVRGSKVEETYSLEEFGCSDQEWDDKSEEDREKFLNDAVADHAANWVDSWGRVETDG